MTLAHKLFSLSLIWCLTSSYAQQNSSTQSPLPLRNIEIEPLNKFAPVKVLAVQGASSKREIPAGLHQNVKFEDDASPDLKSLSLEVENQSRARITCIEFRVEIPEWTSYAREPNAHHSGVAYFHIGKLPTGAKPEPTDELDESLSSPIELEPSQHIMVPLLKVTPSLRLSRPSSLVGLSGPVSTVLVRVRRVFFEDGTMWVANTYNRPDPSSPGSYNRIGTSIPKLR